MRDSAASHWHSPRMSTPVTTIPNIGPQFARDLARAGITTADLDWFDLYSCFPSAVEAAVDALGLDPFDPRGLTVTGGLPYHGTMLQLQ